MVKVQGGKCKALKRALMPWKKSSSSSVGSSDASYMDEEDSAESHAEIREGEAEIGDGDNKIAKTDSTTNGTKRLLSKLNQRDKDKKNLADNDHKRSANNTAHPNQGTLTLESLVRARDRQGHQLIFHVLFLLDPVSSACLGVTAKAFYRAHRSYWGSVPLDSVAHGFQLHEQLSTFMASRVYYREYNIFLSKSQSKVYDGFREKRGATKLKDAEKERDECREVEIPFLARANGWDDMKRRRAVQQMRKLLKEQDKAMQKEHQAEILRMDEGKTRIIRSSSGQVYTGTMVDPLGHL